MRPSAFDGGATLHATFPFDEKRDDFSELENHFHFKAVVLILLVGLVPVWIVCLLNTSLNHPKVDELPIQSWDTIPSSAPTIVQKFDLAFVIFTNPEEQTLMPHLVKFYHESLEKHCPSDVTYTGWVFVCDEEASSMSDSPRQYPFRDSKIDLVMIPCIVGAEGLLGKSKMVRKYIIERISFTYLVKIDADVVVNFQNFFKMFNDVRLTGATDHFYAGKFQKDQQIFTDTELKKVQSYYPKYATSNFYMLTSDLVKWLVEINRHNIRRTKSEDTFVGLILSTLEGIKYQEISAGKDIGNVDKEGKLGACSTNVFCYQEGFLSFDERIEIWKNTMRLPIAEI